MIRSAKTFRRITVLLMAVFLIGGVPAGAQYRMLEKKLVRMEVVPRPRLIAPITQKVILTGKDNLEFRWSPHEGDQTKRECYDFRLYDGYYMLSSKLMLNKQIPANEFGLVLKSDMFRHNHVYTWSLRQVYTGSIKSRRSYSSFRVIKK